MPFVGADAVYIGQTQLHPAAGGGPTFLPKSIYMSDTIGASGTMTIGSSVSTDYALIVTHNESSSYAAAYSPSGASLSLLFNYNSAGGSVAAYKATISGSGSWSFSTERTPLVVVYILPGDFSVVNNSNTYLSSYNTYTSGYTQTAVADSPDLSFYSWTSEDVQSNYSSSHGNWGRYLNGGSHAISYDSNDCVWVGGVNAYRKHNFVKFGINPT